MAVSVTLSRIIKEQAPSTRVLIRWTDGTEQEFATLEEARLYALSAEDPDLARKILIGRFFAANHDGANPSTVENRTITLDLLAQNTVSVRSN